ncbi:hypothetical protein PMAYCL1PPCAC_31635, partial [Pristionchus mayeri]
EEEEEENEEKEHTSELPNENLLDKAITRYLSNKEQTMKLVEIPKPDNVSKEEVWTRLHKEVARHRRICGELEQKYYKPLKLLTRKLITETDASCDGMVTQEFFEGITRARHTLEDVTMIGMEVRTNSNRLIICILKKMFGEAGYLGKSVAEVYAEMDQLERGTMRQRANMVYPIFANVRPGQYTDREVAYREKQFEQLVQCGLEPAFDATMLSVTFRPPPKELFGKCHILYDIVEAMKRHSRFEKITFSRRIHIALGMFYLQGHLKHDPDKYSVNDLAKIDVTCDVLQKLFGTAATDPDEFHFSMSEVINAIKMDDEIQSIMNQIMLEDLQIDDSMIEARTRKMKEEKETSSGRASCSSQLMEKENESQVTEPMSIVD